MNLQELIAAAKKAREKQVKLMNDLIEKATDEGRDLDESEQAAFEAAEAEITVIDKRISNLETVEKRMASNATTIVGGDDKPGSTVDLGVRSGARIVTARNLPKGTAFTRYAMALAAAKGNVLQAAEIAKAHWSKSTPEVETVIRAAVAAGTTTDTTWAKPISEYEYMQAEFIELLRPETLIGRMGQFRNVPFNVRMPRQTSGASAGWVGEGAPKPLSKLGFDQVTLPHAKVAVIIAITEELARWSSPSAEATVRQDMIETITTFLDVQFIDPVVAAVADVSPGAITNGITAVASTGTTVAAVTADLNAAVTAMAVANLPMRNRMWLMHPRTENALRTLRTSQDVFAFRDEMSQGRLLGIPFISTTNMPLRDQSSPASPSTLETYIVLVEVSEIFMADDGEVMLDSSNQASLQMVDNPVAGAQSLVSLWQNNLIGIKAERFIYWQRRRNAAVYVISKVGY